MNPHALHVANQEEVAQVWPAVRAAHLFGSRERFDRFYADAPWRVQVTGKGEAAVLERWRTHLDVLAIRGLWCSADRVPDLVNAVKRVAIRQGFGRVLSPLVCEEVAADYVQAGMRQHGGIIALRYDRRAGIRPQPELRTDITRRRALPEDLGRIISLDAECFDDFWRYDAERMALYFVEDRIVVAEERGQIIGYTLSTLLRDSGTVGRLAVSPEARNRGVGRALLADALGYLDRTGAASVSLCTQEENHASRELYRKMGLVELSGRLLFLICPAGVDNQGSR